jgi:hypothetical protein
VVTEYFHADRMSIIDASHYARPRLGQLNSIQSPYLSIANIFLYIENKIKINLPDNPMRTGVPSGLLNVC